MILEVTKDKHVLFGRSKRKSGNIDCLNHYYFQGKAQGTAMLERIKDYCETSEDETIIVISANELWMGRMLKNAH